MRHSHRTKRSDDQDFKQAVEEALLFGETVKVRTEGTIIGSSSNPQGESGLKLSIVRPEEDPVTPDRAGIGSPSVADESTDRDTAQEAEDRRPWVGEAAGVTPQPISHRSEGDRRREKSSLGKVPSSRQSDSDSASTRVETPGFVDDQSATEDLILCRSTNEHTARTEDRRERLRGSQRRRIVRKPGREGESVPDLPPRGEISRIGTRKQAAAPKQIGHGRLVPSRLTWKPGDPFGQDRERPAVRFRWEVMLTSACITAACGLVCVWLLHTLFA